MGLINGKFSETKEKNEIEGKLKEYETKTEEIQEKSEAERKRKINEHLKEYEKKLSSERALIVEECKRECTNHGFTTALKWVLGIIENNAIDAHLELLPSVKATARQKAQEQSKG